MTASAPGGGVATAEDPWRPFSYPLNKWRVPAGAIIRRYLDLEVTGTEHVPLDGPVIIASNHVGVLDGPLMAIVGPRPVHVLTKQEMFAGPGGGFMAFAGQIPVERDAVDVRAVRRSLSVLESGLVLGVFPEGNRGRGEIRRTRHGAAYFAMVSGAPVVPLALAGTRLPGGTKSSLVPRGTRVVMQYGEPVRFDKTAWPRRRADVSANGERLRLAMLDNLHEMLARTGMRLPGSIPGDEHLDRIDE